MESARDKRERTEARVLSALRTPLYEGALYLIVPDATPALLRRMVSKGLIRRDATDPQTYLLGKEN